MADNGEYLKQMAELLKSGATMLADHCPACNSPLFQIKDEVWCSRCNKRVITALEGANVQITASSSLIDVEQTILAKIQETNRLIMEEKGIDNLEKLSRLLVNWLEALEKALKIQKN